MEERDTCCREIVEVYRQPDPREVVEVYTRPLPGSKAPAAKAPVKRKSRKGLWIFLGCLLAAALLGIGARLLAEWRMMPEEAMWEPDWETESGGTITIPTSPTGQGVRLELAPERDEVLTAQEIYRQVNPSVVTVMAELGENSMSVGTGVVFTQDGYVVTNHHVLAGGSACYVSFDTGVMLEARYVAGDPDSDLAVLKVEAEGLPAAEFGDSDQLTVGDPVYAIGNPLGVELRGTLTDGIVSAINRDVWVDGRTMTLIQTNAALNSGNSGGPLINASGQVVGINVIKMTSRYSNIEGLGFAIPTASMERLVNDLLTFGEVRPEPLLGVSVMRLAEEASEGVWGLRVESVTAGGAGDLAGIRKGDFLLTAGGEPLTTSQDLLRVRRQLYEGDSLTVTLWRDGEVLTVTLQLTGAAPQAELPRQEG